MNKDIQEGLIEGIEGLWNDSGAPPASDWEDYCRLKTALRHRQKEIAKQLHQQKTFHKKISFGFEIVADNTLLHLAVHLGCSEILDILLSKGASLYAKNNNRETPLILAAAMGNNSIVDHISSLISTGRNCSRKDGFSHFHIACMRNNVEIVKGFLQRGVDINARINLKSSYHPGYTALHFAAEFQCVETVELLVNSGADITVKNSNALTPLHLAFKNQNETIIDSILSAHTYVTANPKDSEGLSHLHIACSRNNPTLVDSFLQWGVDVNLITSPDALDWSNYTPLSFAIEYECMDVIKLLLSYNPQNSLHILCQAYRTSNIAIVRLVCSEHEMLKQNPTKKYLNLSNLHVACINNDETAILELLENHVSVNSCIDSDSHSWLSLTPLHLAVQGKDLEIIQLLIECGADIAAKDSRGKTALHLAFENQENGIVDLILWAHVNVKDNPVNNQGLSHFHIAVARDNLSIVNRFLQNGVDINSRVSFASPFWPGYTALHFSCNFKCAKVTKLLLNQNALITFKNGLGLTPLELMFDITDFCTGEVKDRLLQIFNSVISETRSEDDRLLKIIDLLLSAPVDKYSDFAVESGLSLVHLACAGSNTATVERFLNIEMINKPVTLPNWSGRTPLHFAAYFNNREVIELLLHLGADPTIEDSQGFNALGLWWNRYKTAKLDIHTKLQCYKGDTNREVGLFHTACEFPFANLVEYFLKRGIDVNDSRYICRNCPQRLGSTQMVAPLHIALCKDHRSTHIKSVIQMLLKYGANVNKVDANGNTQLHIAIGSDANDSVTELLLNEGANRDLNVQNVVGNTPLHLSCSCNDGIGPTLLLENGADLNIENQEGDTPFMLMRHWEANDEIVLYVMRHVKKLQIVGFDVSDKNKEEYRSCVDRLEDDEEFDEDEIVSECESELDRMKMIEIVSNVTLRDVIFKDHREMALLVENVEFRRILELEDFNDKFPNYGYLLKLQWKKGLERNKQLEPQEAITDDLK